MSKGCFKDVKKAGRASRAWNEGEAVVLPWQWGVVHLLKKWLCTTPLNYGGSHISGS